MNGNAVHLAEKIRTLTSDQIAEVEEFVAFLQFRAEDRALALGSERASEPMFERVWSNPEDDVYDAVRIWRRRTGQLPVYQSGKFKEETGSCRQQQVL